MNRFSVWCVAVLAGCATTVNREAQSTRDGGVDAPDSAPGDLDAGVLVRDEPPPVDGETAGPDGAPRDADPADGARRDDVPLDGAPRDGGFLDVAPGDVPRCESAFEIRDPNVYVANITFGGPPATTRYCRGESPHTAPTAWLAATVPARSVLSMTPSGEHVDHVTLTAWESCDTRVCLDASMYSGPAADPMVFANDTDAPRRVVVSVVTDDPTRSRVDIDVRTGRIADNDRCAVATPLTPGVTLRAQDTGLGGPARGVCGDATRDDGLSRFYAITVPPRTALSTRLDNASTDGIFPFVTYLSGCDASTCLSASSMEFGASSRALQLNHSGDTPLPVIVQVISEHRGPRPVVDITATLRPLPDNDHCAGAAPLTAGAVTRVDHPEDVLEVAPRCPGDPTLPSAALYHAITVPAGQALTVSLLRSMRPYQAFVRLFASCGGACLAVANHNDVSVDPRVLWVNASSDAQRVVVASGGGRIDIPNPYQLLATLRPAAANVTCAHAATLTPAAPVRDVDLLEANEAPPCRGAGGPVMYYAVDAPAGATVTVDGVNQRADGRAPELFLQSACGGTCLGSSLGHLSVTNRGAAQRWILAVGADAEAGNVVPVVDLRVAVAYPP